MKVLVTGATGFVGGAITRRLSSLGHEVIATGRNEASKKELSKYATFQKWDIGEELKNYNVDVCIHSAALADDQSSLKTLRKTNVYGTENVIKSVKCDKFIFISSSSVYNFGPKALKENHEINLNKIGNYGRTKRESELVVLENKDHYESTTILRPRIIYGIGDRLLIPRLLKQAHKNSVKLPGNLDVQSSMCSIDLLSKTTAEIIDSHSGYDTFNVVDEAVYNMKEVFQKTLNSYHQTEVVIQSIPLSIAVPAAKLSDLLPWKTKLSSFALKNLSKNKILSNDKLLNFLNHKPLENYFDQVDSITNWYRSTQNTSTNLAWTNINQ